MTDESLDSGLASDSEPEHVEHDFTQPLTAPVARMLRFFYAGAILLVVVDFFVKRKTHVPFEGWAIFYPVYGFVGCSILVLVAKEMRKVVMRPESYYDELAEADEQGGNA